MANQEPFQAMREVTQTILYDPDLEASGVYGNCVQAAVASALDLPLDAVPHFVQFTWWDPALELFARGRGLTVVFERSLPDGKVPDPGVPCIVGGKSPRGVAHVVVASGGEIVWDPHPSRAGLVTIEDAMWFRKWEHPSKVVCWLCTDTGVVSDTASDKPGSVTS